MICCSTAATGLVYVSKVSHSLYHLLNAAQGYASVLAMNWYGNETLHNTPLSNITLDGTPIASVANVDNFSFAYVPPSLVIIFADVPIQQ